MTPSVQSVIDQYAAEIRGTLDSLDIDIRDGEIRRALAFVNVMVGDLAPNPAALLRFSLALSELLLSTK